MDTATLAVGAVAALATLASVYFAWRAAVAGRGAVHEARPVVSQGVPLPSPFGKRLLDQSEPRQVRMLGDESRP